MKFTPLKNKSSGAENLLWLLAMALAAYSVFGYLYSAALKFGFPYMLNLGEPALSQNIRHFQEGKIPYHDLKFPPYSLVPYGPVYLALAGFLRHFWQTPFVGGRVVGFLAVMFSGLFAALLLRKLGSDRKAAFLVFSAYVVNIYSQRWGVQVNVDMTAVCFGSAALFFFYKYTENEKGDYRFMAGGIILSALAFFTKSSAISAGAAFFMYLVLARRFKDAALYAFIQAALLGGIYYALNRWTDGQYFFHTSYEIAHRRFFPVFIYSYWFQALREVPLFVLASVFFLIAGFKQSRYRLAYLYLAFSVLLTVSLGKQGSDTNYFLEWCVAAAIALGILLKEYGGWARGAGIALVLAQMVVWTTPYYNLPAMNSRFDENKKFYDKISENIRKMPGEILSEDMSLLVANGKEVVYEPFPMGQMSYSGAWDESIILKKLDNRDFSLAILYFYAPALVANRTFTPKFLEMFKKRYHYIGRAAYPWDKSKNPQQLYFYAPNK